MSRATPEDVKAVIDFDPSIEDLQPFIDAANELVTEVCAVAGVSTNRLKIIETWLSAHFIAIRDPRYTSRSLGDASHAFQSQVGLNLGLTPYGQQAMLLDTKGGLAWLDKHISQGKRARVQVTYLGTDKSNYPYRFYGL